MDDASHPLQAARKKTKRDAAAKGARKGLESLAKARQGFPGTINESVLLCLIGTGQTS